MPDFLDESSGVRMTPAAMNEDYEARFAATGGHDSWKLERQQHFRDPAFAGWHAFDQGDWDESLSLLEAERDGLDELRRDAADRGIELYRVRVVEEPIVPYLQWELHLLRLREQYGEKIRVVGPERVREFEAGGQLPELLTVGSDTVYRFIYDESGTLSAAVRYTDAGILARCTEFIEKIYADGEELSTFFERKVAPLAPPRMG